MKLTVTPTSGQPAGTLDELADMIRRAQDQVRAGVGEPSRDDLAPAVRAKVLVSMGGKVKSIEVSW